MLMVILILLALNVVAAIIASVIPIFLDAYGMVVQGYWSIQGNIIIPFVSMIRRRKGKEIKKTKSISFESPVLQKNKFSQKIMPLLLSTHIIKSPTLSPRSCLQ